MALLRTTSHLAGFWLVAACFVCVMAYSTVPSPLYPLYQQRDGFPVSVLTAIFAAYAVGVIFSLFFVGHVSDVVGRRRMLVIAALVSVVSAVMFLLWPSAIGLLAARFVNGASIGILTAAATAHLAELRERARPNESGVLAATVASAANLGGLALGPLIGGLFAEYLPAPLVLPHAVFLVVLLVVAIALTAAPETVAIVHPRPPYRVQRLAMPPRNRPAFVAAALGAFAAFALFGLFTALAPTILTTEFDDTDHLVAGALAASIFVAAAVAQALLARVELRTQLTIAIVCCATGLATLGAGAVLPSLALFVVGGVIAGAGVGILFRSAIATVSALAEPDRRGETLALLFLIAYLGPVIPVIALGISLSFAPEKAVLAIFSALVLVVTVGAGLVMRRAQVGARGRTDRA